MEKTNNQTQHTIYRFKFSDSFTGQLFQFAKLHQYDDRHTFKESWEKWIEVNTEDVSSEIRRLSNLGYNGDVLDKMYKSARYYFRKKSTQKVKPKKRRIYVSMDRDLLDSMDKHITHSMKNNDFCPANGFDDYCVNNKETICNEVKRLLAENLDGDLISAKIKKTYKNRYFQISQNICK